MLSLLKLLIALLFCVLCVQCEDRRDIHRIILKTERNKKHSSKKPNNHQHKTRDYEPHGSSLHEQIVIPNNYKFSALLGQDYQDLIKPRPPTPTDFFLTYPEEHSHFDHTYNLDTNGWSPLSNYEQDQASGNRIKKKKQRRKPTEDPFLDFTTSKPLKNAHPAHFEHFVNFKKISKSNKAPVKMHSSYEVYEEVQENEPPKSMKASVISTKGFNNLPFSYKNNNHFLPTVTTFIQDVKYGTRVNGRKAR